jgi:hypothetical protein
VLGTMHAFTARRHGHEVVQLEREAGPRGASVRNFGLVWVSGRAAGPELALAQRARELWAEVGAAVPGVGFRPRGSLTIVRTEAELDVARHAAAAADAGARGFELLDADGVRKANPALRGEFLGGLLCTRDGSVEPRLTLGALREHLAAGPRLHLPARPPGGRADRPRGPRPHRRVAPRRPGRAGHRRHLTGIAGDHLSAAPIRRCRLQMMQTAPLGEELTTSVADGDSFRYYPAYRDADLAALGEQRPIAAEHRMQLLMVQRADGGLTIGDTHAYDEPFAFDVDEAPTSTCARSPRPCWAGSCRRSRAAGPGCTARSRTAASTTAPRSAPGSSR